MTKILKGVVMRLTVIVSFLLSLLVSVNAAAYQADEFLKVLEKHYQPTKSIKAFSLAHSYFGRTDPYESWDFEAPGRYQAFKVTEIDFANQFYYQNVVHHNTGGLYFDEVHFQNEQESLRYERNGIPLGKGAIEQNLNSYERYKNLTLMNLDFFAVRPLLAAENDADSIDFQFDKSIRQAKLTHRDAKNAVMEYVFDTNPLRLKSITNKTRNRIYLYDDYRTNNGHHFAHSVIKHYNGEQAPSFISRIESFSVITEIDTEKLRLPDGYTRISTKPNQALELTPVAPDLYLIADASAAQNTLVHINGDSIMAFGAPMRSEQSRQTIALIKERFPEHRIKGVHITHPYREHIAGLLPYAQEGIKIFADAYTVKAIKAYPQFANDIDKFAFVTLSNEQKMDAVRFYVLENGRSRRQSFAYFEQSGIIFQSDFLEVAYDNTIANILPSYSKQFIDFIRNKELKVTRIVNNRRNNNISPEVMSRSYDANTR